jgi:hypothetical protein
MGHTQFNSRIFGAEHLMLEDEAESVDIRSRRRFAANIILLLGITAAVIYRRLHDERPT